MLPLECSSSKPALQFNKIGYFLTNSGIQISVNHLVTMHDMEPSDNLGSNALYVILGRDFVDISGEVPQGQVFHGKEQRLVVLIPAIE